jgi:aminoglycoside phosphotransferase (APT) family kinase protein
MSVGGAATGTPAAEHAIDTDLVRRLLADQHPDLADLPLMEVEAGWDNSMFRLGEQLVVRMPRRAAAAALIAHEQRWLPRLAHQLALPIPVPYRTGTPARGYPWSWSILPWLPGDSADQHPPFSDQAVPFAIFLRSLHTSPPADAPQNPVRGGPLGERAPFAEARLRRLSDSTSLITSQIRRMWEAALRAPIDVAPTWIHGDLHPRNILVAHGAISGVIDWGDMAAGDRATDLAAIWMLFDDPLVRDAAVAAYGELSPATLARAQGWALHIAAALLDSGLVDNPRHALIGERILRRLQDGASPASSAPPDRGTRPARHRSE